ncbi:hypothetical protein AVEN_240252-1, partial [Araneus ventricosus]
RSGKFVEIGTSLGHEFEVLGWLEEDSAWSSAEK